MKIVTCKYCNNNCIKKGRYVNEQKYQCKVFALGISVFIRSTKNYHLDSFALATGYGNALFDTFVRDKAL